MPLRVGPLRAGALQAGCARPIQAWTGTWGRQRRRKVWPAAASSTHPVPLGSGSEVLTQLRSSGKPGRAHLPFLEGPGSQKPELHTAPLLSAPPQPPQHHCRPSATPTQRPPRLCPATAMLWGRRRASKGPGFSLTLLSGAQPDRQPAPEALKITPESSSRQEGAPHHLHGDVGREDQQAERLQALGQAAGRLPGGQAVAHVRGAGEGGGGLNKSQGQDQEDGEAQNPGRDKRWSKSRKQPHSRAEKAGHEVGCLEGHRAESTRPKG